MQDWPSHLWYETVYLFTHMACTFGASLRTEGRQNIPRTGPVLIIANHQSFVDPVLVGLSTRRHLWYLARKSLFRNPVLAGLIRSLNAVPIDQEGVGKEGLKTILGQLRAGHAVVVFPEGTRTEDGHVAPFRPGVHLLISRADCYIVPVGIAGAFEAWPYWKPLPVPAPLFLPPSDRAIAVSVGKPLRSEEFAGRSREQVLADLYQRVRKLKERAERLRRST
jgi:1-acyl-sn-glycerol-3-phosphate acyltransferase